MAAKPQLDQAALEEGLRGLGIEAGDTLVVHSALSAIGTVDGGADTVVRALLAVLGPRGRLAVPTFTYSSTTFFDVRESPSKTGLITETVRRRPDAVRSWSATHSVTIIGPEADALVAGHLHGSPLGVDSPLDRLAKLGGKVLLLGVDHRANSTVHVGECYADAPYLLVPRMPGAPLQAVVRLPDGTDVTVVHSQMPGCSAAFGAIELALRRQHAIRDGSLGAARCQLMPGQAVIDATVSVLKERMDLLLCGNPRCAFCAESRKRL